MTENEFVVILCTTSPDESEKIAKALVEEKLAACVNTVDVNSYFRWSEELCKEKETLLIIKTEKKMIDAIIGRIRELHSYELPEIIALPIIEGYDKYLTWITEAVRE